MKHPTRPVTDSVSSPPPRHRGRRKIFERSAYPDDFHPRHCGCEIHKIADLAAARSLVKFGAALRALGLNVSPR